MRTVEDVENNKAKLNATKTQEAVLGLPPGFIVGFRLSTANYQMIIGKGVMNCRGKRVEQKSEHIIDGGEYISPDNIIRGLTYYVYMNSSKEIKVDSIAAVWDDDNFGYYHPALWQFRFLGQFDIDTDGTYKNLINQDPVIGTDIDARNIESLLIKTLLAQVTDYIVVGQDPEATPTEGDWACFIYEDRMEIKQYSSGTWLVKQKFGSSTIIEVEIYLGFHSFSGTTTLDSPGEGDTVHYISGTTDQYQEYTNGGWVVTANGLKLGGLLTVGVASLFLNMVGCGGCYHPNNPPTNTEFLPHPGYRVFNFENNYEDQHGVDDWVGKTNPAFDATTYKFGDYSLTATSGNRCALTTPTGGTLGSSQSVGAWFYFSSSGTATANRSIQCLELAGPGSNDLIYLNILCDSGESDFKITFTFKKGGSFLYIQEAVGGFVDMDQFVYLGFDYDSANDKLYIIYNNTIYDQGVIGGTWGAGGLYLTAYADQEYVGSGVTTTSYIDEVLHAWDKYLDPNLLAQHYTHNVPWNTSYSRKDIVFLPDTDGRNYSPVGFYSPQAKFTHRVSAGTNGGTATAGSWQTRTLNTEEYDTIGCSLTSDQITIPAGTYDIEWRSCHLDDTTFLQANTLIYDVTNAAPLVLGLSINYYSASGNTGMFHSSGKGRFTAATSIVIELQYRVLSTQNTNGLGRACNWTYDEVYAELLLTKIA